MITGAAVAPGAGLLIQSERNLRFFLKSFFFTLESGISSSPLACQPPTFISSHRPVILSPNLLGEGPPKAGKTKRGCLRDERCLRSYRLRPGTVTLF